MLSLPTIIRQSSWLTGSDRVKRLTYAMPDANVNKCHDELLTLGFLKGAVTHKEDLTEPIIVPITARKLTGRIVAGAPEVADMPTGELRDTGATRVRAVATVAEPNLRVESINNEMYLTVPDDANISAIDAVVKKHQVVK